VVESDIDNILLFDGGASDHKAADSAFFSNISVCVEWIVFLFVKNEFLTKQNNYSEQIG
jgi:hypothetical protein